MVKNSKKIIPSLFLLLILFAFKPAFAFDFSGIGQVASIGSIANEVGGFFNFFSQTVFGKIKTDFCENYRTALKNGDWKTGEFRTNLGDKICPAITTLAKITATANPTTNTPTKINTTTKTTSSALPNITKISVPQNPVGTSQPLVGNTSSDHTQINTTQIIYWTNIERTNATLPALSENSTLDAIAEARVEDMFAKGYFEHISPTGQSVSTVSNSLGYKYIYIGENIAMGNFGSSRDLLNAWMASPGHKANILNTEYTEIGVAAKQSTYNGSLVWISAQIFGKPLSSCPSPDPNKKTEVESDYATTNTMQTQAQNLLAEIKSMNPSTNPTSYNSKVSEYNSLVDSVNALISKTKDLITNYNNGVTAYNTCIKE